jgi:hypothetical protein
VEELRTYQYPREKKPSRASTRMTMRMIHRMLTLMTPLSIWREEVLPKVASSKPPRYAKEPPGGGGSSAERAGTIPADPASSEPSHPVVTPTLRGC